MAETETGTREEETGRDGELQDAAHTGAGSLSLESLTLGARTCRTVYFYSLTQIVDAARRASTRAVGCDVAYRLVGLVPRSRRAPRRARSAVPERGGAIHVASNYAREREAQMPSERNGSWRLLPLPPPLMRLHRSRVAPSSSAQPASFSLFPLRALHIHIHIHIHTATRLSIPRR